MKTYRITYILLSVLTVVLISACSPKDEAGSLNPAESSKGILRFSLPEGATLAMDNLHIAKKRSTSEKVIIDGQGSLIINSNQLEQTIQIQQLINEHLGEAGFYDLGNGVYEIRDIEPGSDFSLTLVTEQGEGIDIDAIPIRANTVQDLQQLVLGSLNNLNLVVKSATDETYRIEMAAIEFQGTITSNSGSLNIDGIPNGSHFITLINNATGETVATRYLEFDGAQPVNVVIDLNSNGSWQIGGSVLDQDGIAISAALITIKQDNSDYRVATSAVNGDFLVDGVATGNFTLIIKKDGFQPLIQEISVNTDANLGTLSLNSESENNGSIVGYVVVDDIGNNSLAGIEISMETESGAATGLSTSTVSTGAFLLDNIPDGRYKLNIGDATNQRFQLIQSDIIEVVGSSTRQIEKPFELIVQTSSISGSLNLPDEFGSTDNLSVSVLDSDGKVITSGGVDQSGNYLMNDVPVGSGYTLRLTGADSQGNTIVVQQEQFTLLAGQPSLLTALEVEFVDPNPPVIHSISFDAKYSVDPAGNILINPSVNGVDSLGNEFLVRAEDIMFSVSASDADGDELSYDFSVDGGEIISINSHQMIWRAPFEGDDVTINFKVNGMSRSSVEQRLIKVNHPPVISITSHDDSELIAGSGLLSLNSSDLVSISIAASDYQDGLLSGDSISWHSDLQGELGTGANLLQTLMPGYHTITITATDSKAVMSSRKINLQINAPELILLKDPAVPVLANNAVLLENTFDLVVDGGTLSLIYQSNDTEVATVDENGLISSVASGTAVIQVASSELDDEGKPVFSADIVVRVIGEANPLEATSLGINQYYRIRLNSSTIESPFILPALEAGTYQLLIYDETDIVTGSRINSKIQKDATDVTVQQYSINDQYVIHEFNVPLAGESYSLYLQPADDSQDTIVTVALFPGVDVYDAVGNYINQSYWDSAFEPNDINQTATPINLQQTISSELKGASVLS